MKVDIRDAAALQAISPAALSAYARAEGWSKFEPYGDYSDVYTAEHLPEIILPRTQRLGDFSSVVARLIKVFADAAQRDELSLYHDLVTADRDVVRVRVSECEDGSLPVNHGVDVVTGARDMLLAAACSLREPQPVYRAGANREAADLLDRVHLGQTEQGSFVVALLTPAVPPPIPTLLPDPDDYNPPIERRMTKRLAEALAATREAVESGVKGEGGVFASAVEKGVSANFCEALDKIIGPFPILDVGVSWARTRMMQSPRVVVKFSSADVPILREAARSFRDREPRPETRLFGVVQKLNREAAELDGTISLRTSIDGRNLSVTASLKHTDYNRAIQAHREKSPIILQGDLERVGQRWRLLSPRITDVIRADISVTG